MFIKKVINIAVLIGVLVLRAPLAAHAAPGDVWLEPASISTGAGNAFVVDVYADTGAEKLAAYQFTIKFDPSMLGTDTSMGNNGAEAGSGGFVAAVNLDNVKGVLIVNGFDLGGKGPGTRLQVLRLYFKAIGKGRGVVSINLKNLANERGGAIGVPSGGTANVEIW